MLGHPRLKVTFAGGQLSCARSAPQNGDLGGMEREEGRERRGGESTMIIPAAEKHESQSVSGVQRPRAALLDASGLSKSLAPDSRR